MKEVVLSLFALLSFSGQASSWYLMRDDVTAVCTREKRHAAEDGLHACLAALNDGAQKLRTPLIPRSRRLSVYLDVIFDASPTIFNVCCESHAAGGRTVTVNPLDTETRTDALETRNVPFINLEKIGHDFIEEQFTLMLIKLSYDDRYLGIPNKPLILWMVTDIAHDTVSNGHVQIPYLGPACSEPDNTYMFLLYRQAGPAPTDLRDYSDPSACPEMKDNAYRCQFDVNRFVGNSSMQLVGASWFHCVHSTYSVYKIIHEMDITEAEACASSKLNAGEVVDGQLVCPQSWISGFFSNPLRFGNIPKKAPATEAPPAEEESSSMPNKIVQFLNAIFGIGDDTFDDVNTASDIAPEVSETTAVQDGEYSNPENPSAAGQVLAQGTVVDDVIGKEASLLQNSKDDDWEDDPFVAIPKFSTPPEIKYPLKSIGNTILDPKDTLPIPAYDSQGIAEVFDDNSPSVVATGGELGEAPNDFNPAVGKAFFITDEVGENGLPDDKVVATGGEVSGESTPINKVGGRMPSETEGAAVPVGAPVATGGEFFGSPPRVMPPVSIFFTSGGETEDEKKPPSNKLLFKPIDESEDDYTQNTPGTTASTSDLPSAVDSKLPEPSVHERSLPDELPPQELPAELPSAIDLNLPKTESAEIPFAPGPEPIIPDPLLPNQLAPLPLRPSAEHPFAPEPEPIIPDSLPPNQLAPLPLEPSAEHPFAPEPEPIIPDSLPPNQLVPFPLQPSDVPDDVYASPPVDPPRFSNDLIGDTGMTDDDRRIDFKGLVDQLFRQANVPQAVESPPRSSLLSRLLLPSVQISRPMSPNPFVARPLSNYFRMLGLPFFEGPKPVIYSKLSISRFPGYANAIQSMESDGVQSVSYVETPSSSDSDDSISSLTGTVYDGVLQGDNDVDSQPLPEGLFPNPFSIEISEPVVKVETSSSVESPFERFLDIIRRRDG